MSKNKWGYAVQPNTFCAIDASTNSLAFALFNTKDSTLGSVGKINFEGRDIYEKVMDAGQKVKALELLFVFFYFFLRFDLLIRYRIAMFYHPMQIHGYHQCAE